MLWAVIMAGGSGTRFWPLSRRRVPKQFLALWGGDTLLRQTFDRSAGLVGPEHVFVITGSEHLGETQLQLPELPATHLVGEPCGRDTAPCVALAAKLLHQRDTDARMAVLAADHLIPQVDRFHDALRTANAFLDRQPDALMTFGIPPARPATGYGYLERAANATPSVGSTGILVHELASFHEKPTLERAEEYVASGRFFWNSGIFVWRADTILLQVERHLPELHAAIERIGAAWGSPQQTEVFEREYEALTKVSIDYGVMEKASPVFMVEAPFTWDDVGSWLALERVLPPDADGNVVLGLHAGLETKHCVVAAGKDQLIATLGVEDLIIVQTGDVTLVAHRDKEQEVKALLKKLESEGQDGVL